MAIKGSDEPHALIGQGTIFDGIAYWVTLVGVYVMVGGLMFYSGKEKLFDDDGNAPSYIKEQFKGTFLDTIPGTDAAWVILGILEPVACGDSRVHQVKQRRVDASRVPGSAVRLLRSVVTRDTWLASQRRRREPWRSRAQTSRMP